MTHISIKNLNITYQNFIVLQEFSANFAQGIHWVQGINGSGKSSLLKCLCGIVPVNQGMVNVAGYDLVADANSAKAMLCYVPDKPEVYPFMTGLQFLKLIAQIKKVPLQQDIFDFMDAIKLTPFNDTPFAEMSFGTRRKFSLCSVFIGNPGVILLDEPFNGLDKNTNEHLTNWLKHAKKDKCIVLVSHDSHIVEDICDTSIQLT